MPALAPVFNIPPTARSATVNAYVDPDSRRLIFVGDEQTATAVSNAIASLDKPKPQAWIKVVFLQVTYNNGYDVGEGVPRFSTAISTAGYSFPKT